MTRLASAAFLLVVVLTPCRTAAEDYSFSSREFSSVFREGEERTVLRGDVRVESAQREITAARMELSGGAFQFLNGDGGVVYREKESGLLVRTESFRYDGDLDLFRAEGPTEVEDPENEVSLRCGYLENDGAAGRLVLQYDVMILKDEIVCRGEFAVYWRDRQELELTGMPVVYRDRDSYRADRIVVNLDSKEIRLEGAVSGALTTDGEAETETGPPGEDSDG